MSSADLGVLPRWAIVRLNPGYQTERRVEGNVFRRAQTSKEEACCWQHADKVETAAMSRFGTGCLRAIVHSMTIGGVDG